MRCITRLWIEQRNTVHCGRLCELSTLSRYITCYRPQRSCGKVMFSQASVILFTGGVSVPACSTGHMTRGSLSRRVSVWGIPVWDLSGWRGLCLGGCPGGLCLGDLCPGDLSGGSLSRGSLSRGGLSPGVSVRETPPYGNKRVVCILLECILVRQNIQKFLVKCKRTRVLLKLNYSWLDINISLLAFIDKYGVLINQWPWLYEALSEVSVSIIALWINVYAHDWTA